jgi:hypothetical protein
VRLPESDVPHPDTLSDVLEGVRLTGALFFLVDAWTPWVAEAPATAALAPAILPRGQQVISYHLITRGACWCAIEGRPPVSLSAGDVIVIPTARRTRFRACRVFAPA